MVNDACLRGRWLESTPDLFAEPVDLSAFKRPPYRAARLVPRDRMARYVKVLFGMPGAAAPPTEYRKLSLQTAKGSVSFAAIRRMP